MRTLQKEIKAAKKLPWQYVKMTPEEWGQIIPSGAITKNIFREIVRKVEARAEAKDRK